MLIIIHMLFTDNRMDVGPRIIGQIYDIHGNMDADNCEDDVCQSVLLSADAASAYASNSDAELHFTQEAQRVCSSGSSEHTATATTREAEVSAASTRHSSSSKHSSSSSSSVCVRVPAAAYTCSRASEYWASGSDGAAPADSASSTLEEVTEVSASVHRGDVLYLPMGRDQDMAEENVLLMSSSSSSSSSAKMNAVSQHAPCRWCQVLAVDLLFARLWVRPCSAAPECWLHDAAESGTGIKHRKGSGSGSSFWLPVSLLWDAVVFSPEALPTTIFHDTPLFMGQDIVKSVTRNGITSMVCKYTAFNVPSLSSSAAIAMLSALAEMYPAVDTRPNF
jgi:hypothetical protein